MSKRNQPVLSQLDRVVNKILFLKKKSLFEYKGVEFYPSEVHVMLAIQEGRSTNATKMAEVLGVTKGAVSQTLTRLVKKGVIAKSKDPYNKNELTLTFTTFGKSAFKHYSVVAEELTSRHDEYLNGFTKDELNVIHRFLEKTEDAFGDID